MTEILQLIILWGIVLGMLAGCVALIVFCAKKWWEVVRTAMIAIGLGVVIVVAVFVACGGFLSFPQEDNIDKLQVDIEIIVNKLDMLREVNNQHVANIASNKAIMVKQAHAANVNFAHMKKLLDDATKRLAELEKAKP